jgi:phage recombination protein Bet
MTTALINSSVQGLATQISTVKAALGMREASDADLALFAAYCQRTGLDPFAKQIYMLPRRSRNAKGDWEDRWTIQSSIDGLRTIAERSGHYAGQEEPTYGPLCDCGGNIKHPESATVRVLKLIGGQVIGTASTAYWHEFVQTKNDGTITAMWAKMPRVMLAKVAEAQALRKAFPSVMAGVYTDDEMAQADNTEPAVIEGHVSEPKQLEAVVVPVRPTFFDYDAQPAGLQTEHDRRIEQLEKLLVQAGKNPDGVREDLHLDSWHQIQPEHLDRLIARALVKATEMDQEMLDAGFPAGI